MNKRLLFGGAAILLALAALLPASAQKSNPPTAASDTGSLVGTVEDHHGVPVGGATVTVVSISTHQTRTGNTDGKGAFSFDGLPEGEYHVTAAARGLLPKTEKVHIKSHHRASVGFKLKAAEAAST